MIHTTTINSTRGVSSFVRFGKYPVTVPQDVIDTLQIPQLSTLSYSEENVPHSGDSVLITEGIFFKGSKLYIKSLMVRLAQFCF